MVLKCDWARFNRKTEQSFLYGNVSTQKDVQRMKDEGTYKDFLEEQAEFGEMVEGA